LDDRKAPVNQRKIIQQRRSMALAIVQTFENSVKRGRLSPGVARISGGLWGKLLLTWNDRRLAARDFRERTHRSPPLFKPRADETA
jgi:fatty acid-binding protein DegV